MLVEIEESVRGRELSGFVGGLGRLLLMAIPLTGMFFLLNVPQYIGWLVFNEQYMGLFLGLGVMRDLYLDSGQTRHRPQCRPLVRSRRRAGRPRCGSLHFHFLSVNRQFPRRYRHRAGDPWLRDDSACWPKHRAGWWAGRWSSSPAVFFSTLCSPIFFRAIFMAGAGRSVGWRLIFISMPMGFSARRCRWASASSSSSSFSAKCSTSSAAPSF